MTAMDDATLLTRFEDAAIPRSEWTHRAHVRMAYLYLRAHPFDEALARIRAGIQKLNAANGVHDGYHETVTVAFATLIADAMARTQSPSLTTSDGFCDAHDDLFAKDLLLRHYSRERINSDEARAMFVAPDNCPLPPVARAD